MNVITISKVLSQHNIDYKYFWTVMQSFGYDTDIMFHNENIIISMLSNEVIELLNEEKLKSIHLKSFVNDLDRYIDKTFVNLIHKFIPEIYIRMDNSLQELYDYVCVNSKFTTEYFSTETKLICTMLFVVNKLFYDKYNTLSNIKHYKTKNILNALSIDTNTIFDDILKFEPCFIHDRRVNLSNHKKDDIIYNKSTIPNEQLNNICNSFINNHSLFKSVLPEFFNDEFKDDIQYDISDLLSYITTEQYLREYKIEFIIQCVMFIFKNTNNDIFLDYI